MLARPQLWRGRGRDLLGPVAYVDVDGTPAPTPGNKKAGMDMSYKGGVGIPPAGRLAGEHGRGAPPRQPAGNAVSHQGAAEWIDRAVGLVAPHAERVCAWTLLERPCRTPRTGRTREKREDEKARIVRERGYVDKRLDFEHVAEFEYRPVKCGKTCRMVAVRKNISRPDHFQSRDKARRVRSLVRQLEKLGAQV